MLVVSWAFAVRAPPSVRVGGGIEGLTAVILLFEEIADAAVVLIDDGGGVGRCQKPEAGDK